MRIIQKKMMVQVVPGTGKAGGARLEEEVICLLIDIGGLTKIFQYVKLLLKN